MAQLIKAFLTHLATQSAHNIRLLGATTTQNWMPYYQEALGCRLIGNKVSIHHTEQAVINSISLRSGDAQVAKEMATIKELRKRVG